MEEGRLISEAEEAAVAEAEEEARTDPGVTNYRTLNESTQTRSQAWIPSLDPSLDPKPGSQAWT